MSASIASHTTPAGRPRRVNTSSGTICSSGIRSSKVSSASEKTRRASHGASPAMAGGSPAAGGAPELAGAPRLRSHGNVRRPSTICGSVPAKAPAALRGGMTDATSSGASAKRGPATSNCRSLERAPVPLENEASTRVVRR